MVSELHLALSGLPFDNTGTLSESPESGSFSSGINNLPDPGGEQGAADNHEITPAQRAAIGNMKQQITAREVVGEAAKQTPTPELLAKLRKLF